MRKVGAKQDTDPNPAACELFGVPRDALVGRTVSEFGGPGYDTAMRWFHRTVLGL